MVIWSQYITPLLIFFKNVSSIVFFVCMISQCFSVLTVLKLHVFTLFLQTSFTHISHCVWRDVLYPTALSFLGLLTKHVGVPKLQQPADAPAVDHEERRPFLWLHSGGGRSRLPGPQGGAGCLQHAAQVPTRYTAASKETVAVVLLLFYTSVPHITTCVSLRFNTLLPWWERLQTNSYRGCLPSLYEIIKVDQSTETSPPGTVWVLWKGSEFFTGHTV